MSDSNEKEFIENIIRIVDKWSFKFCAYCDPGTVVSIEGMVEFKCIKCGRIMKDKNYLDQLIKVVFDFREKKKNKDKF